MSGNDKFGLGYEDYRYGSILSYENEVLQSVFMNKARNYMPSGPDVEIDYSIFTYGSKQTSADESDSKPSEYASCESDSSVETSTSMPKPVRNASKVICEPKVWTDAPIIKEQNYSSQAASTSTASKVNTARPFVNDTRPKRKFYKTHSPTKRSFHNTTVQRTTFSYQKFHAIGNKSLSAVRGNGDTAVKASTAHLIDYQEFKDGSVAFGGSNGRITGKGKIKTDRLDCEDVYYVEELKHYNLFSVPGENQVLLKIPRQHNMYSFNLKNIDPSRDLACLFAKASIDESNKWHRRLGHVNFKNLNKLVKGNLVRGLPSKIYENDHTCVACQKGKQHKASCLVGFFLKSKDEATPILKDFIRQAENQFNHKVKTIRSDNGTKFKNKELIEFCGLKGIKKEYSNAKTLQQNRVSERKNRTLIEATRTMLANSFLPTTFWAEAGNNACYVLNRVLVTKPQNKTPYELLTSKQPIISYLRPFGCLVTILNTIDQLGKFDGKSILGFLVGYFLNSKAFRVYNLETNRVEENLHVNFLENKPNVTRKRHAWMFDLDYLTNSMNYEPVSVENQANKSAGPKEANNSVGTQANDDQGVNSKEIELNEEHFILPIWSAYSTTIKSSGDKIEKNTSFKTKEATHDIQNASTSSTNLINTTSTPICTASPSRAFNDGKISYPDPSKYAIPDDPLMPYLKDIYASPSEGIFTDSSYDDEGVVTDFNILEATTRRKVIKNSEAHALICNLERKQLGLNVSTGIRRIEAIRIFLAFDSYMGFIVYQMNVKSAFLYGTIDEKVYVSQPPGFEILSFLISKELDRPKQTALGKDISNLLMAAKPTKSEGFKQIIDFLNGRSVKTINDEVRIQALIDEKRVNIEESSIRHTLKLDKAEGTSCLANAEIFDGLAKMGYEKLSEKLTFSLWHQQSFVLIQIRSSTSQDIYDNPSLTKKVFANMKRVGTSFSRVVTTLFDNMLAPAAEEVGLIKDDVQSIPIPTKPSTFKPHKKHKSTKQQSQALKVPSPEPSPEHKLLLPSNDPLPGSEDSLKLKELMNLCTHLSNKVLELESEVIDIKYTYKDMIEKLEGRVDRLEEENGVLKDLHSVHSKVDTTAPVLEKEKSFKQGRIIANIDDDVEINLEKAQAKLYRIGLEHPEKLSVPRRRRGIVIQDPEETRSTVVVHSEVQSKDKGKGILIEVPKSLKGKAHIEQDEAFARQLEAQLNADINWNAIMDQVKRSERLNDAVMNYQALKRKPLTEAQARNNIIIYMKNMVGFKMNYFKGMTYSEIRALCEKHYNYNQAFLEEVNEEIIYNDDDDVYTEATLLASKIPIVDFKIHFERNKPYSKIIRADGNHMLFLSFSTLLKNFNREDLESLWKLVKERFEKTEPKNYSDDYLLKTLKTMFEQPDVEASVWRDQTGRYGLAKRHPLIHFNLEQMMNNFRLEVEEESKMSLELLRLVIDS
uniref:Integrase catalytic domain-containing protein n=1 Tax=Tanacetum cinerariifolium TaxID=118510 RepID=A0A6L2MHW6_TANCI|nr:hypothetical protein [Tanacetum cinerariifolium]